jgi:O-acetyl-ADP-ribose deacetylase (regulator of RNase III)
MKSASNIPNNTLPEFLPNDPHSVAEHLDDALPLGCSRPRRNCFAAAVLRAPALKGERWGLAMFGSASAGAWPQWPNAGTVKRELARDKDAGVGIGSSAMQAHRVELNDTTIELVAGNIVEQPDVDALVNAANAELLPGGGVAGAIHRAAGPGLAEECRPLAPISPGEAVITGGQQLSNPHVIHCLGPVYGVDRPEDELLAACYRNALNIAGQHGLRSVAFPAISTGAFGYPMEPAAQVALGAVLASTGRLASVHIVRFVLDSERTLEIHEEVLRRLV